MHWPANAWSADHSDLTQVLAGKPWDTFPEPAQGAPRRGAHAGKPGSTPLLPSSSSFRSRSAWLLANPLIHCCGDQIRHEHSLRRPPVVRSAVVEPDDASRFARSAVLTTADRFEQGCLAFSADPRTQAGPVTGRKADLLARVNTGADRQSIVASKRWCGIIIRQSHHVCRNATGEGSPRSHSHP